jgi:SNF2 family DNA or RNA helicase
MGVLSPHAISQFLNTPRDAWDWMKREPVEVVATSLRDLTPRPRFGGNVKLWLHQKVCFLLMVYLQRFMLFLDMGGGKSLCVLMVIKYLKNRGIKPKVIVFVPYVITVDTWVEEAEKWTDLKVIPLIGSTKDNLKDLDDPDGEVFVIAYQSAVAMLAKKGESHRGKKKVEWILDANTIKKHFKNFNMIVMDEVHRCKNIHSMTYRMCRTISNDVDWAFGLTGTPFGKDLQDLWAQFFLIDMGETLGKTLGLYRAAFFRETINYWGGYEYKFKHVMMPMLERIIKHRSMRYRIDECHDMPQKSYITKYVNATADIATYYDRIVEALNDLSFGKIQYRQLESTAMKLRQLSSGFMTLKGDDDSKAQIKFPTNPKLDALQEIIESMPDDSKMIVFHDFRFSNGMISQRLKQIKIAHARVWGEQQGKVNLKEIRRFKKDPRCRVLVINCQSGSSSQNLQVANYVVYFEQPRSAIDRQQSERRAWRPGQEKRVFIFDLLMKGTVDEKQMASNAEGKDLLKAVLDGSVKFGKLGG